MKIIRVIYLLVVCWVMVGCAYQRTDNALSGISDERRLALAQAHILLGQFALSKAQLDQVSEAHQGRNYWRLRNLYWFNAGKESKALAEHERALSLYPDDDFILNNYGVLLGKTNHWQKACHEFKKASLGGYSARQSVWINLSRCELRQFDVKLSEKDLNRAKEIDDLPLIGLMTELNLVLIRGNLSKARLILNNIQADTKHATNGVYFDEYNCLSRQVIARETDPTIYSSASTLTCLDRSRY